MSYIARYSQGELSPYVPPPHSEAQDFRRVLSAILHRWRLFVSIWLGFVFLVALITLIVPKTYTTTVRLMPGKPSADLNTSDRDTSLPILNALVLQNGEQSAETFAELARQEDISSQVIQDLKLGVSPQELLGRVSVKPVVNTPILNLSITWRTPQSSAQIANAYATAFISRERDFVRSQATAAIGFLSQELPNARKRMNDTAGALADFQSSNGFIDAGAHTQDVVAHAASIDQKIELLSVDSREAKALLSKVKDEMAAISPTIDSAKQVSSNPVLTDLRTKLTTVNTQLSAAESQYTERHPTVVALRQQRQALLAQIAAQPENVTSDTTTAPNPLYQTLAQHAADYDARIQGNTAQIAQLRTAKAQLTPQLHALPTQSMRLATLQQDAKRAADVYNALEQKYSDAIVAQTTAISDITIVQPASADAAVKRPSIVTNVAVAIVVGLLLALAIVFVLDTFERRVRSDVDTRQLFGLPLLGRIPAFDPPNQRMLPWVQSMTIEAFLHLCVTLRIKNKHQLQSLAITSPCRGDGKSTVALNLAKAMANLQPRVLLIDADMRRPMLHQQAGCMNEHGLSDVLKGDNNLLGCVFEVAPNLDLLPSGHEPLNPVALLQSRGFDEMMTEAKERYAMIIVDSPALTSVTDGLLISTRVDGTVFVVAADSTDEREARHVVSQFAALGIDNVLGVVLNKDTKRMDDYSDYFAKSFGPALRGGSS